MIREESAIDLVIKIRFFCVDGCKFKIRMRILYEELKND
jgi:hypothetical protein